MIAVSNAPIISLNDQPPGKLSFDGGVEWNGPMVWNMLHGEAARSIWVGGKMVKVEGVSIDGLEEPVSLRPGHPQHDTWRHLDSDGKTWIHGDVIVDQDGLRFVTSKVPEYNWKAGTLPGEIFRSKRLIDAVDDFDFAGDVYGALCSLGWQNTQTGKQYWGTWRTAAEVIVSMRGRNESYTDFFLMGNEGLLTSEVRDAFSDIGWTCIGRPNRSSRRRRALNIVEACELRQISIAPDWYRHWSTGLVIGEDLGNRMHLCAASGRASFDEWNDFWEFLLEDAGD